MKKLTLILMVIVAVTITSCQSKTGSQVVKATIININNDNGQILCYQQRELKGIKYTIYYITYVRNAISYDKKANQISFFRRDGVLLTKNKELIR